MTTHCWSVGYIPRKHAQTHPNKTALIFEDLTITYGQLNQGVNRCANMLLEKGIKKGDRVCVLMLNCVEFLEIYFAVAWLGGIFVPLNWKLKGSELAYQINHCEARFLFFHDSFLGSIDPVLSNLKANPVRRNPNSNLEMFIYMKNGGPKYSGYELPGCPVWAEDYVKLMANHNGSAPLPPEPVLMSDPLAIVYTSGVTGKSKGVVVSHEQTFYKNFQIIIYTESNPRDILIAQVPLFDSDGLFSVATPALNVGMTMVLRREFSVSEFAADIQRYRGTIIFALNSMWWMIIESGKLDEIDISSVRCVVGGGEQTPSKTFEALSKRGLHMQQGFSQTENSAMTLMPREDIYRKLGSIGKPGYFTDIWIEDNNGKRLSTGEIGEIVASGPTVMTGYWNMPEKTKNTIVDGVLYTGDLGYMDEEGFFYIVDRAKDMYRCGGKRVYPVDVEKVLINHPDIDQIAIIGVADERLGEVGAAFIVPVEEGMVLYIDDITDFLRDKLPTYKQPFHIVMMDELPLTATMKVKKSELKSNYFNFSIVQSFE